MGTESVCREFSDELGSESGPRKWRKTDVEAPAKKTNGQRELNRAENGNKASETFSISGWGLAAQGGE